MPRSGPLDYRVPDGMLVEPGSVVVAPLGPRQLIGVVWEPERLPTEEIGDNACARSSRCSTCPPIAAPLRRLAEWTADYYLEPAGIGPADDPAFVQRARRLAPDSSNTGRRAMFPTG